MAKADRKIRILFTIPNFDTAGTGRVLLNLARELDSERFEPHILCLHDRGFLFEQVRESGIPYHIHTFYHPMKPRIKGLLKTWETSRFLKEIDPDIIHSFNYSSDYSEPLAARLAGIRWVFTKKNMSWGGSSKNSWKLRSWLANRIIVQNKDMISRFYPNSAKIRLIPRGVRHELYRNQISFGSGTDDRIIICVANLVPRKGIEILLHAFDKLKNDFPDWKVHIVGDDKNDYAEGVKTEVKQRGLQDRFLFKGKQKDIVPFLNKAEIFVLPTNSMGEGSPVALLEAMANGKVVIGSAVPGIRDQLEPFPDHLFEVGNESDLADKIRPFLVASTAENELTGNAFSTYVRSNYDFREEVAAHTALYREITG